MLGRTLSIFAFAAAACSGEKHVVYVPQRHEATLPAAQVAPDTGEVRISSGGVRRVTTSTGAQVDAFLVRLAITNDSSQQPWSLDMRDQVLVAPTGLHSEPLLGYSEGVDGVVVPIGCGERRVVELYYVVPPAGLESLTSFDLMWRLDLGPQLVSRHTSFDQVRNADATTEIDFLPERPVVVLGPAPGSDAVVARRPYRDELDR